MKTRRVLVDASIAWTAWLLMAAAAEAQSIYTCKDRSGHTISSDRPIPECADRPMRETTPGGVLKREIAPPLTPDQQAQKDADDRVRRLADEAAREKRRRDMALLAAYSNEDQIDQARKRSLVDVEEAMRTSRARLDSLQKEKQTLAIENRQYGAKLPPLVQRRVDDNQAAIDDENAAMKLRAADVERINQRYDDELKRFRELMVASKSTTSR